MGNQLVNLGNSSKFTCGVHHLYAYHIYCTACYMSASHYNSCYRPIWRSEVSTFWCPCKADPAVTYDERKAFGYTIGQTSAVSWSSSQGHYYGGLAEQKAAFTSLGSGNLAKNCKEH